MSAARATVRHPSQPLVIVAGHICLDVIPALPGGRGRGAALRPGALDIVGPVTLAVGGCVGNTGIALHRLGARPVLVARIGDDPLADVLTDLVGRAVPREQVCLLRTSGAPTSYSVVLNRPGEDRAIAHFPGVNDTFVADDIPSDLVGSADLVHVGYPPLMAALVADDGRELGRSVGAARRAGAITSLDMANANLDPGEGAVRWRVLLERVLPDVDVFVPSLDEACHLLGRRVRRDERGAPLLSSVARLADELVAMGAGIAGVKLGEHGLYVRTSATARQSQRLARLGPAWSDRELHSTVFESAVVGTVGAGDTTIAGLLYAILAGMSPEEAVTAACAVGGSSTEAPDGTSGVPGWQAIERRLQAGWRRQTVAPEVGWTPSSDPGLRFGPRDTRPSSLGR